MQVFPNLAVLFALGQAVLCLTEGILNLLFNPVRLSLQPFGVSPCNQAFVFLFTQRLPVTIQRLKPEGNFQFLFLLRQA